MEFLPSDSKEARLLEVAEALSTELLSEELKWQALGELKEYKKCFCSLDLLKKLQGRTFTTGKPAFTHLTKDASEVKPRHQGDGYLFPEEDDTLPIYLLISQIPPDISWCIIMTIFMMRLYTADSRKPVLAIY